MKTYIDAQKFFDDCIRYINIRNGNREDPEKHYYRTQQMEFQLPEWERFNLSIHAAALLDPDVDFFNAFFDAMKRHDAVCWWLILHSSDRAKYEEGKLGYYDILAKAEKHIFEMRDAKNEG